MAAWRVADSLLVLRAQINAQCPGRDRASDGTIGDLAHQASASDHNPDGSGVVRALDVTFDPAHGCDTRTLGEQLRVSRDGRVKYYIAHGRMFSSYASGGYPAWTWRPYSGSDPHTNHGHLSVVGDARADGRQPWAVNLGAPPAAGGTGMSEWAASPGANAWALTQGSAGYAGQQRDTALAFAWQNAAEANARAVELLAKVAEVLAEVRELADRPPITLTDAQVATLGVQLGGLLGSVLQAAAEAAVRRVLGGLDGAVPPPAAG